MHVLNKNLPAEDSSAAAAATAIGDSRHVVKSTARRVKRRVRSFPGQIPTTFPVRHATVVEGN